MKRLFLAAIAALTLAAPRAALADSRQHLVDSTTLALQDIMDGSEGTQVQSLLRKAKGVVICPNIFKAGFIFGGEGGGCLMLARGTGGWSNPAFYGFGGGSFGLQAGVQSAELMMLIMTDDGLNALLNSHVKLGADAGLTIATLGAGVNGSMALGLKADIISFSKSQGLYGGISLAGSVLSSDTDGDQIYYGTPLTARQIVVGMQGNNPGANPLRTTLTKYGG